MAFNRKGERTEDEAPRQAVLGISFNQIENILQLPKGYHIAAIYTDAWHRSLEIVVDSPDFPEVPNGQYPPRLPEVDVTMVTKRFRDSGVDGYWQQTKVTYRRAQDDDEVAS